MFKAKCFLNDEVMNEIAELVTQLHRILSIGFIRLILLTLINCLFGNIQFKLFP